MTSAYDKAMRQLTEKEQAILKARADEIRAEASRRQPYGEPNPQTLIKIVREIYAEEEKAALIGKLVGFVAEFIESHELTDWCHELPGGGEESIEAYLIPKREVDDLKTATKSFLEASV